MFLSLEHTFSSYFVDSATFSRYLLLCCHDFASACFLSSFATKRKSQGILHSVVRYEVGLAAFHIKLNVGG